MNLLTVFVVVAMVSLMWGCKKDEPLKYDCTGLTPTYTVDIKPIFDANCVSSGCHNSGSKRAGYDLSSYSGAKSASGKKALMGSIQHLKGYSNMPRGKSKLSNEQLKTISCWIENGAVE